MATQADIDKADASVKKLEDEIAELNHSLHGGKCDTLLDAVSYVGTNFKTLVVNKKLLKVEGGYAKVQCGPSIQLVMGLKGEHVAPWNYIQIMCMESKTVIGLATTTIRGSKSDTIIGVKADILAGTKYENHSNKKQMVGASPKATWLPWLKHRLDYFNRKAGTVAVKTSEYLLRSTRIQELIEVSKENVTKVNKVHAELKEQIAKLKVDVKGEYVSRGDTYSLDYTEIYYNPGDGVYAQGSGASLSVYSHGPYIESGGAKIAPMSGSVVMEGTTFRVV